MSSTLWLHELVDRFHDGAGGPDEVKRDLRRAALRSLPVTIVSLPVLRVGAIDRWLQARAVPCALAAPDRPLRACLVAARGYGVIFLDGADPAAEQRFSLAHELGHFLHDYLAPRERAEYALGADILPVLDGDRTATGGERVHAVLAGVPLGVFVHLLQRDGVGRPLSAQVARAEREADLLAFALLAPEQEVLRLAGPERTTDSVMRLLIDRFGLPAGPAARYAAILCPVQPYSLASRLRAAR